MIASYEFGRVFEGVGAIALFVVLVWLRELTSYCGGASGD